MIQSLQSIFTKLLLCLGLVSLLTIGLSQPINAAGKVEMTMSPARTDFELKAGQDYTDSFRLYNTGEIDFKVKFYAEAFKPTNDGYTNSSDSQYSQLHKWIKLDINETTIKAGDSVEVKYTVNTPEDIPDGGQYGILFAETINESNNEQTGVGATSRIGLALYATTDGQNRYAGEFHDLNIPGLVFGSKANFSVKAKNTGNTHYFVNRTIDIKGLFGQSKFSNIYTNDIIAPEVDRELTFEWDNAALFDIVKVTIKANAVDKKDQSIFDGVEQTKTVIFISPILIIGIIVIIIIAGGTYVASKKTSYHFKK